MPVNPAVVELLRTWARDAGIPATLALAVAWGESGLDVDLSGDNGLAHGLIQVRVDVHGGPAERWTGLDGALRSLTRMQSRWRHAFATVAGAAGWDQADAEGKARILFDFWPAAQGCQQPTLDRCRQCVTAALAAAATTEDQPPQGGAPMPVSVPSIVQKPGSPSNCYPDRQGFAPEAIVLHVMDGTLAGCDSWFASAAAQAGAHFGVGKNGEIHQYYRLSQAPFANGAVEDGYTATLVDANNRANPNFWTISIEHEGRPGDPVPDAQLDASVRLAAWLWQTAILPGGATGVALDRKHILRHGDISPRSRPSCPGWSESFIAAYIQRVAALIAAPAGGSAPLAPAATAPATTASAPATEGPTAADDFTALALGFEDLATRATMMAKAARAAAARHAG
jgi:hypothetical protein